MRFAVLILVNDQMKRMQLAGNIFTQMTEELRIHERRGLAFTAMHFRIRAIVRRQVVNHATLPITEKRQILKCI